MKTTKLVLVFGALLAAGCGASWQSEATVHLGLASRAVVVADRVVATHAAVTCPAGDVECIHAHHIDVANDAIAAAKSAIAAGEHALENAVQTDLKTVWDAVAPCLASAVTSVLAALMDAEVPIPAIIHEAMAFIAALVGPCIEPTST